MGEFGHARPIYRRQGCVDARRRQRWHVLRICAALGGVALLLAAFIVWPESGNTPYTKPNRSSVKDEYLINQAASLAEKVTFDALRESALRTSSRAVYPYSIIPGGILTPADLRSHMDADHSVSAHYRNFDVRGARVVPLRHPVQGYVSYRRAAKIYWTTKRLLLAKGELVLTDGAHIARIRCANRVVEDRGLIPPEELDPDPEEAIATRVLDDPQPPVVPASIIPDTNRPALPVSPPSPPLQPTPPSPGPPGTIPPTPPLFLVPTHHPPSKKVPDVGVAPSPAVPTPVPEPPTIVLLLSGVTGIVVRLWRRRGG